MLTRIELSPLYHSCRYERSDLLDLLGPHAEEDYDIDFVELDMLNVSDWFQIWPGLDGKRCSVRYFDFVLRRHSLFWHELPESVGVFRVSVDQLGYLVRSGLICDDECELCSGSCLVVAHLPSWGFGSCCCVLDSVLQRNGLEVVMRRAERCLSESCAGRLPYDVVEVWEVCG